MLLEKEICLSSIWERPSEASPIFIIGCQRSGTTLLRSILYAHPQISIGYECAFYKILSTKYLGCHDITEKLDTFLNDLYAVKRFDAWGIEKNLLREIIIKAKSSMNFSQVILLIADVYRQLHKPGASIIGFKNPNAIFHLSFIFQIFPNAKILHIIRDVRGICASEKKKRLQVGDYDYSVLWSACQRYKQAIKVYKDNLTCDLLFSCIQGGGHA